MNEFGSSWTTARTYQTIRAISCRVADPACWSVGWRICVRPGIRQHASGTGARFHGGRWVGAHHDLTTSLHFAVQMDSGGNMVGPVDSSTVNSDSNAGVWKSDKQSTCWTIVGSIERLGKMARHWWISIVGGMKATGNAMWLYRCGISQHRLHHLGTVWRMLHAGVGIYLFQQSQLVLEVWNLFNFNAFSADNALNTVLPYQCEPISCCRVSSLSLSCQSLQTHNFIFTVSLY